jgi:hypothetical protein
MPVVDVIGVGLSAFFLVLLCLGDPKRSRTSGRKGGAQGSRTRWLLVSACVSPGLAFALAGEGAAFLIWLGGTAMAGWLVTLLVPTRDTGAGSSAADPWAL